MQDSIDKYLESFKDKTQGSLCTALLGTDQKIYVNYEILVGQFMYAWNIDTRILDVLAILKDSDGNAHEINIKPVMTEDQYESVHDAVLNLWKTNNE